MNRAVQECIASCVRCSLLPDTTPSYVILLPIPLALSCRMLNVLSSRICSAYGAGVRGGDCCVFDAEQGSQVQSLLLRYCVAFKSPEHFECTHPEHMCTGSLLLD